MAQYEEKVGFDRREAYFSRPRSPHEVLSEDFWHPKMSQVSTKTEMINHSNLNQRNLVSFQFFKVVTFSNFPAIAGDIYIYRWGSGRATWLAVVEFT